jgi:hypothetical protein
MPHEPDLWGEHFAGMAFVIGLALVGSGVVFAVLSFASLYLLR